MGVDGLLGVPMRRCVDCGRVTFPGRAMCPGCAGAIFDTEVARYGVVEELTRPAGGTPPVLATIRSELGPVVIAALHAEVHSGQQVALSTRHHTDPAEPVAFVPVPTPPTAQEERR